MNLRDLIYSQNTDDSSHNYEFENLGNFEKEQFDDLIDSTLHPDSKAYSSKKDYSKRFYRYNGNLPSFEKSKRLKVFSESPQVCLDSFVRFNYQKKQYAPGYSSYIKFDLDDKVKFQDNRKTTRQLFNKSYFSKDIEIAIMALNVLSDIDSVQFPDFLKFLDLIKESEFVLPIVKLAMQMTLKNITKNTKIWKKNDLISSFLNILLIRDENSTVESFLNSRVSDFSIRSSNYLLSLYSITQCFKVIQFTYLLQSQFKIPKEIFPLQTEFLNHLLSFHEMVYFLNKFKNANLSEITDKKSESIILLNQLAKSFSLKETSIIEDLDNAENETSLNYNKLYLGYLIGTDNIQMATQQLKSLFHKSERLAKEKQIIFLMEILIQFGFSSEDNQTDLNNKRFILMLNLIHHYLKTESKGSLRLLYFSFCLFQFGILNKWDLIRILCDFIECSQWLGKYHGNFDKNKSKFNSQLNWVVWRTLMVLLGEINQSYSERFQGYYEPSDLNLYHPTIFQPSCQFKELKRDTRFPHLEHLMDKESDITDDIKFPGKNKASNLREDLSSKKRNQQEYPNLYSYDSERAFLSSSNKEDSSLNFQPHPLWKEHVFSASQYGPLEPSILNFDCQALISECENSLDRNKNWPKELSLSISLFNIKATKSELNKKRSLPNFQKSRHRIAACMELISRFPKEENNHYQDSLLNEDKISAEEISIQILETIQQILSQNYTFTEDPHPNICDSFTLDKAHCLIYDILYESEDKFVDAFSSYYFHLNKVNESMLDDEEVAFSVEFKDLGPNRATDFFDEKQTIYFRNSSNLKKIRSVVLGDRNLELLTFKSVVFTHFFSPDNLFVLRAIQILFIHAFFKSTMKSAKSLQCISWLISLNMNLRRISRLSFSFSLKKTDFGQASKRNYFTSDYFDILGSDASV